MKITVPYCTYFKHIFVQQIVVRLRSEIIKNVKRKKDNENARDSAKIVGLSGTLPTGIKMIKMKEERKIEKYTVHKKDGDRRKGL